ncbi:type II toxin-antitoxin system Phd/YefM family antitoxin [Candidatus Acetothermia bacterium]|nr:type II toxin-antitoxin system Phd/YefM family antitoxin [Candidatus Acetothermia bacterium]
MSVVLELEKMKTISSSELSKQLPKLLKERLIFSQKKKPKAVVMMSIEAYESLQMQLLELQKTLDHILLFFELQARKNESNGEITLEELKKQYGI